MDIGFIGLGRMGSAMARNLVAAGHSVRAWNRSGGLEGVSPARAPEDAFQADAVFTMLSDDAAIREVVLDSGLLRVARPGLVHVVSATISVEFATELSARHAEAGVGYVSAPVFGRPEVAAQVQLNMVAAGAPDALEKVRPALEVLARKVWVVGEDAKQANIAKIAGNMMITMAIEALAEAAVLTQAHGLPKEVFYDLVLGTLFAGRTYETYSAKIRDRDYEAGFRATLGLKDLGLALAASKPAGASLPMLAAVHGRMKETVDAAMGDRDWSAMADYTLRGG